MEYGLDPAFAIYAGGLGILAGDHMKSAGDLHLPVTGIGLLWDEGTPGR
jgi:starch phosphorylase